MTIYFYTAEGLYGCFSNYSRHGFLVDELWWPTSQHYFQAQKFAGTPYAEEIRMVVSPKDAARLGRGPKVPVRPDWEAVKDEVMRLAVRRKFETTARIRDILLQTGDEILVEDSPIDSYWGTGEDRTGQNRMGQILMELRAQMRTEDWPSASF